MRRLHVSRTDHHDFFGNRIEAGRFGTEGDSCLWQPEHASEERTQARIRWILKARVGTQDPDFDRAIWISGFNLRGETLQAVSALVGLLLR